MPFKPEKITRGHVEKAVQKIKTQEIRLHPSTGYDVVIEGEKFPPKEIMRYAHEQMNGEKIWEKPGGDQTNKYLENLGFEIMEKNENEALYNLKEEFLSAWPFERVKQMSLEEYTNLNKDDSFCYWLESRTNDLGSIWGGSSYKFGIYKRNNTESDVTRTGYQTDGEYSWVSKYGDSKEVAFQNVKENLIATIEAAINNQLAKVDEVDLGNSYKWKIAFLYSNFKVVNIFSRSAIRWVGKQNGLENADNCPISEIHKYLIQKKPEDKDYFDYTSVLWDNYQSHKEKSDSENDLLDTSNKQFWMYSPRRF